MRSIFIIALLATLLQLTVVACMCTGFPVFNLPLAVLVFFGLRKGASQGVSLGIFLGLIGGFFNISPAWINIFIYASIGLTSGLIGKWLYRESPVTFSLAVFCAGILYYFPYLFFSMAHGPLQLSIIDTFFRLILPASALNALICVFLFYFFRKVTV